MRCLEGQFLATIRKANNVFIKFIALPTTCIVLWDIAHKLVFRAFEVIVRKVTSINVVIVCNRNFLTFC